MPDVSDLEILLDALLLGDDSQDIKYLRKLNDDLGGDIFPKKLKEKYHTLKKMDQRISCVYHAIFYASSSNDALQLGIDALYDKSYKVKYVACLLLAYSLKKEVIPALKKAESLEKRQETIEDIRAAIDAIEHDNFHFFVDPTHSGKITLKIL